MKRKNPRSGSPKLVEPIFDMLKLFDVLEQKTKENARMLEQKHDHFGKIIVCHLVIENLMDGVLRRHLSLTERAYASIDLGFRQKIYLLPSAADFFEMIVPGLTELNSLRNKIAHRLNYNVESTTLPHIEQYLTKSDQRDLKILTAEQKIEAFTRSCIGLLSIRSDEVESIGF